MTTGTSSALRNATGQYRNLLMHQPHPLKSLDQLAVIGGADHGRGALLTSGASGHCGTLRNGTFSTAGAYQNWRLPAFPSSWPRPPGPRDLPLSALGPLRP